MVQHMLLEN